MARYLRISLLGTLVAAQLALVGCASSHGSGPLPATGPPSGSPTVSPTALPPVSGSPSGGPSAVALTDRDNGRAVTLRVGERLVVTLDSPFWTFQPVTASAVLRTDAVAVVPPTASCPPPMGSAACGGQSASYTATGVGRAVVLATRVVCGEAARCTGSAGRFEVVVTVAR